MFVQATVKTSTREGAYVHLPQKGGSEDPPPETVLSLFEKLLCDSGVSFDSAALKKDEKVGLRTAINELPGVDWTVPGEKSFYYRCSGVVRLDRGNHLRGAELRDPADSAEVLAVRSMLQGSALEARTASILELLTRAKALVLPVVKPRGFKPVPTGVPKPPRTGGRVPASTHPAPLASSRGGAQAGMGESHHRRTSL